MTEITSKCLSLDRGARQKLIRILQDSLMDEGLVDDGSRFSVLYKIATELCGQGILSAKKRF